MTSTIEVYNPMSSYTRAINKLEKMGSEPQNNEEFWLNLFLIKEKDIYLLKIYLMK